MSESADIPWWCPANEEWMNRFSENDEFKLRNEFKMAGKLHLYEQGVTDVNSLLSDYIS